MEVMISLTTTIKDMKLSDFIPNKKNLAADRKNTATPKTKAVDLLIKESRTRAQKDIDNWNMALRTAERYPYPRRYLLLDIYKHIIIDAHLSAQLENRKNQTLQSRFYVSNNNKVDDTATNLLYAPWFHQLINHILDARFYGHSLIQIDSVLPISGDKGGIQSITLVPRQHLSPQEGLLLKRPRDMDGIKYRETPEFDGWIIETPDVHSLGLLNQTAPHVLYKRFAQGAWSEFTEIFGMPLRIGKTNTTNTALIRDMENMLARMASLNYAVIDENETIEFIQAPNSKGEVYKELIGLCNNEISKVISGSVIGEDSQGGSRAKEEVGERITTSATASDKQYVQSVINTHVFPVLIKHGYPLKNASFHFQEEPNLDKLWKNTHEALQYYNVDPDWVKNTFGIEVTGEKQTQKPGQSLNVSPDFFD